MDQCIHFGILTLVYGCHKQVVYGFSVLELSRQYAEMLGQIVLRVQVYGTDPFALHLQIGTYVDGGGGFADPALP